MKKRLAKAAFSLARDNDRRQEEDHASGLVESDCLIGCTFSAVLIIFGDHHFLLQGVSDNRLGVGQAGWNICIF